MGIFRNLIAGTPDPLTTAALEPAATFAVDELAVPPEVFGLTAYAPPTAPVARIDRRSAMQVPAVKRSRDLIAGTLGTVPIDLIGPDKEASTSNLLEQPEKDTPRSVTMTKTFEDMLFEKVSWWRVVERDWRGYPTSVRRLQARSVNVRRDGRVYVRPNGESQGTAWEWVADRDLIRFDSPNDALLEAGARAIRICIALENAAFRYADGAPPLDYFTPVDGTDPGDESDIIAALDAWKKAREQRVTGYVPAAMKLNTHGWSPEQLEMSAARDNAVKEIARVAGVDPEELGVSTTSRTYANQFDRRKNFLDFTLGGFISAMQDRLSMNDVSPRGYVARMNLDAFLRSDAKTRYETYEVGLRVNAISKAEIRQLEDRPALSATEASENVRALPSPSEEVAS